MIGKRRESRKYVSSGLREKGRKRKKNPGQNMMVAPVTGTQKREKNRVVKERIMGKRRGRSSSNCPHTGASKPNQQKSDETRKELSQKTEAGRDNR